MTDANSITNYDIKTIEDTENFSIDNLKEQFNKSKVSSKAKKVKDPLIRIVKRADSGFIKTAIMYILAILVAIAAGGLFIIATGNNPIEYYKTVFLGCFSNRIYINNFIQIIIPLIITSLGISFAFKMKFWNIGANGQFIVGAISAATAAILLQNTLPQPLTMIIVFFAGALGGGLFGLIPAFFKIKFDTNETLFTLMLNYVAGFTLIYLKKLRFFGKLNNGTPNNRDFEILPENSHVTNIIAGDIRFDISLIIALILIVLVYLYFKKTKQGYEIEVVGDSQSTAKYAGMNVNKIIIRTMFIGAAIIGAAGMLQVTGSASSYTLCDNITSDVGWTAIIVAWLAKLNPFGIFITSLLMGVLQKGSSVAESSFGVSPSTSAILEGVILFSVLAADFFTRYKISFRTKRSANDIGGNK